MFDEKFSRLSIPAFESIDFQGYDPVCKSLIIAIEEFRSQSADGFNEKKNEAFSSIIQRILRTRFKLKGLVFRIYNIPGLNGYAIPPQIVKNSVMVRTYANVITKAGDGRSALEKNISHAVGWVNRADATVGGFFQEVPCAVGVTMDTMTNETFSHEEIAATILHEVGHIFSYLETLAFSFATCFTLVDTVKRLGKASSVEEKVKIFKNVESATGVEFTNKDLIAGEIDPDVVAISIFSDIYEQTKSEFGSTIYDQRAWESLSDQFSSRMGLAVPLATATDKMQRLNGKVTFSERVKGWGLSIARFFLILGYSIKTFGFNFRKYIELLVLLMNPFDRVYDKPNERIQRLRQDVVQRMKSTTLSAEERQELAQDFDALGNLITNLDEESYYEKVWLLFSSKSRDQKAKRVLLQDLQSVANNNLFAAANLLQTLK